MPRPQYWRTACIIPFAAAAMLDAIALWSAAHRLADLLISGQLFAMQQLSKAGRETAIISILERTLPKI